MALLRKAPCIPARLGWMSSAEGVARAVADLGPADAPGVRRRQGTPATAATPPALRSPSLAFMSP